MPEISETLYSSDQINIPPAFPYLLRQYAKAAIRSQPTDLLQWSTAYFRCLSLNIPPPAKPRLEYPIPREYCGITPGWLKALLYQLSNNRTIHFKILWDRWTGACLSHNTLIEMLCLGEFDNHKQIPCFRFIGLCAAHLTDNLTNTMKLICEIITEEPEGGSAIIPYETFMDLYIFLAKIDASKPQLLKNIHFDDTILNVYKSLSEGELAIEKTSEIEEEEESEKGYESINSMEIEMEKEDSKEEISCPSLIGDDHYSVDYYYDQVLDVTQVEEEMDEIIPSYLQRSMQEEAELGEEGDQVFAAEMYEMDGEDGGQEGGGAAIDKRKSVKSEKSAGHKNVSEIESVETITGEPRKIADDSDHDLIEDLERLKEMQEIPGEEDVELEKYKCRLLEEMPLTDSQQLVIAEFKDEDVEKLEVETIGDRIEEEAAQEEQAPENIEIWIEAVPGIGPIIPNHLITAVQEYMKNVAAHQHNMVMPRNIRNYNCPPLEIVQT